MIDKEDYWSFNVKFEKNKWNWKTFEDFKEFAKMTTDDNYLAAIRNLLLTNKLLKAFINAELVEGGKDGNNKR